MAATPETPPCEACGGPADRTVVLTTRNKAALEYHPHCAACATGAADFAEAAADVLAAFISDAVIGPHDDLALAT